MGKFIRKVEKWETKDGYITTYGYEEGPKISKKEAVKLGILKLSKKEMQKLFSVSELEELGYDNIEKE